MNYYEILYEKINCKEAIIGVIGLGYVGLPLALTFAEKEFSVFGFDIDSEKVKLLNQGISYLSHIPASRLKVVLNKQKFKATNDFSLLSEVDVIIICVPTPLTPKREPDLRFIKETIKTIKQYLKPGQLVSLESTTYPGTTEELLLPLFTSKGLEAGKEFFLIFSPEREDPGNPHFSTQNIPRIVGGITPKCSKLGHTLYSSIINQVKVVSSPRVAEMAKLLENIYRSINIALVNELKILAQRMGIDIWEVIEAASTKPFGFTPFYPGPGMGGHCIPVDPFYLSWKAKEYDFTVKFIELAGEINISMPYYVVERIGEALNQIEKSVKGSNILILGMTYKKDIGDMRESPALPIIKILQSKGAIVHYNDPFIPKIPPLRSYKFDLSSVPLTAEVLQKMDVVVIVTDHSSYDYKWIVKHSQLVVDTRNATSGIEDKKIIKA